MENRAAVQHVFAVVIEGVYLCVQAEIPAILESGGSSIVNAGSMWGLAAYSLWSPYMTAKHAVSGMAKAAVLDYAKDGIRVNAVAPGPILTPLRPSGWNNDPAHTSGRVPIGGGSTSLQRWRARWSGCSRTRRTSPPATCCR